ncbi:MAG: hypothetical protein ACFCVA_18730 [Gammaproteobacteria bacterium]
MKYHVVIVSLLIGLLIELEVRAEEAVMQGAITKITQSELDFEGETYSLSPLAECLAEGAKTTCGTLAGVGYAEEARVVVNNGRVVRIEVLKLWN